MKRRHFPGYLIGAAALLAAADLTRAVEPTRNVKSRDVGTSEGGDAGNSSASALLHDGTVILRARVDEASPLVLTGDAIGLQGWGDEDLSMVARPHHDRDEALQIFQEMLAMNSSGGSIRGTGLVHPKLTFFFLSSVRTGDLLVLYEATGRPCRLAVVAGPYEFVANQPAPHRRPLRFFEETISWESLRTGLCMGSYDSGWPIRALTAPNCWLNTDAILAINSAAGRCLVNADDGSFKGRPHYIGPSYPKLPDTGRSRDATQAVA